MTNIISIYNLSKAFDGKKLFQNFNFTVKKNSVHALIGANGAGKTTLLRLLTGLYEPDEGKYLYRVNMQCCLRMIIYMRIKQVWRT